MAELKHVGTLTIPDNLNLDKVFAEIKNKVTVTVNQSCSIADKRFHMTVIIKSLLYPNAPPIQLDIDEKW